MESACNLETLFIHQSTSAFQLETSAFITKPNIRSLNRYNSCLYPLAKSPPPIDPTEAASPPLDSPQGASHLKPAIAPIDRRQEPINRTLSTGPTNKIPF